MRKSAYLFGLLSCVIGIGLAYFAQYIKAYQMMYIDLSAPTFLGVYTTGFIAVSIFIGIGIGFWQTAAFVCVKKKQALPINLYQS